MALENKLGLTSSADLAREEERIRKKKPIVFHVVQISIAVNCLFATVVEALCGAMK